MFRSAWRVGKSLLSCGGRYRSYSIASGLWAIFVCNLAVSQDIYYFPGRTDLGPFAAGAPPNACDTPTVYGPSAKAVGELVARVNNSVTGPECFKVCRNPTSFVSAVEQSNGGSFTTRSLCTGSVYTFRVFKIPNPKQPTSSCDNSGNPNGGNFAGNPCNIATGAKVQTEKDYLGDDISGISFVRIYNSHMLVPTRPRTGMLWRDNYDRAINFYENAADTNGDTTTSMADVWRPNGQVIRFNLVAGAWQADPDIVDRLQQITDDAGTLVGWRYITSDETVETYDPSGRLESISNRSDQTQTLSYDSQNRLVKVTGHFGHTLTFEYDSRNRISVMRNPAGEAYRYSYDGSGNLVRVTYPDNSVRQYRYESGAFVNGLTGILDENNDRYASWTYDQERRVTSSEHANGQEKVTIAYNNDGSRSVTDALGNVTTHRFMDQFGVTKSIGNDSEPCAGCGNQDRASSYDDNGYLASRTDFNGHTTRYVHDERGLEIARTEAADSPEARVITSVWHPQHRILLQRAYPSVAAGERKVMQYDYADPAHPKLPTRITWTGFTPDGQALEPRVMQLTYNADGRVTEIDGWRTDVEDITRFSYYPNSVAAGTNRGLLHQVTNALGHTVTYEAYDAHGQVLRQRDANAVVTEYQYDARQRVTQMRWIPPAGEARTTSYAYDAVGQLLQSTTPAGVELSYTYNAAHEMIQVSDNLGNSLQYSYDAKGNRSRSETRDPDGSLVRWVEFDYDARDRLTRINTAGSLTNQLYDIVGNLSETRDPNGNRSQSDYDALNRLTETVDALAGVNRYRYDVQDRVTQVQAPNGARTDYSYDDFDNQLQEHSPDRGVRTATYDAAGNRLSLTDARGITAQYRYDALNRPLAVDYPGDNEDISFVYDSGPDCSFGIGRLCRQQDESGITQQGYDAYGNLAYRAHSELGVNYITRYRYDADDNLTEITYPSGRTVRHTRDALRRISAVDATVEGGWQNIVGELSYRADALLTGIRYGNAVLESRQYDLQGRLQQQSVPPGLIAQQPSTPEPAPVPEVIRINFQKAGTPIPDGYLSDSGEVFGDRGNGQQYGWNQLNTANARDRNNSAAPDQRFDTLNHMQLRGSFFWEIAVPNGTYQVRLIAGDPSYFSGHHYRLLIEDVLAIDAQPNSATRWIDQTVSVSVNDGRLTIDNASGAIQNRIAFVEIVPAGAVASVLSPAGSSIGSPTGSPAGSHTQADYQAQGLLQTVLASATTDPGLFNNKPWDQTNPFRQTEPQLLGQLSSVGPLMLMGNLSAAATAQPPQRVYSYDANGNLLGVDSPLGIQTYSYDALDRLSQDSNPLEPVRDYRYDPNDNRLQASEAGVDTLYQYAADSNRLLQVGAVAFEYDASGNRLSDRDGQRRFEYNNANRLYRVFEAGTLIATYTYNALGQRTRKVTAQGTTLYHYGPGGALLSETTPSGAPIRDYVWLDDKPIAQIDRLAGVDQVRYLHSDHLDTPRSASGAQGSVLWQWFGEAFGNTPAHDDPDGDGQRVTINLRFPGQYYDEETGLHYNGARYYDASMGRYLTADPIGILRDYSEPQLQLAIELGALEETGFASEILNHLYGYVGSNPLVWFDPYGLAKGGKQNFRDTGLSGLSDEEVSQMARDTNLSSEERRKAQKEEKVRKTRNKNKRTDKGNFGKIRGGSLLILGPLACEVMGPSPFNPFCMPEPPPDCNL